MCRGLFLEIKKIIARVFSKGWGCLAQCHCRKYKVSNHGDKTEQSDPHCVQGWRSSTCTLLLHSATAHITLALAHNPTGMEEGWREPGRSCSWFVSLLDVHLQLYSSLPLKFPFFRLFSTTEDVTRFSHQREMFTWKSQLYFAQCVCAR